jgi:hypothetical protein
VFSQSERTLILVRNQNGCHCAAVSTRDVRASTLNCTMRWLFIGLIVVHGLIHFLGFAKAFGLAALPQLTLPISRGAGVAWLAAGLALLSTAALLLTAPRIWWAAGLGAVVLSQIVMVSSWSDAKYGTIANAILLAGVVYGFALQGPPSFRADYARQVRGRLAQPWDAPLLTSADIEALPEPARVFLMDATRSGLPVDVFHAFRARVASMRVRLLSFVPMVDASGPDLDRAETVTLLNDLCLLAPGALVGSTVRWESIDARSARVHYTVGPNTVSAHLSFNETGELVDFVSDDRLMASPDGQRLTPQRWSTPIGDYRQFGSRRAAARGEGRWHLPDGEFVYLEIELLDLDINGAP